MQTNEAHLHHTLSSLHYACCTHSQRQARWFFAEETFNFHQHSSNDIIAACIQQAIAKHSLFVLLHSNAVKLLSRQPVTDSSIFIFELSKVMACNTHVKARKVFCYVIIASTTAINHKVVYIGEFVLSFCQKSLKLLCSILPVKTAV
jgi:hypothetical protein